MSTVQIPAALRDYADGNSAIEVEATTVDEALRRVARQHPLLRRHLYNEHGVLRNYVNVFVNQDDIRSLEGIETAVQSTDTLLILPSIAGG